ncbi:MAG: type II toxin-antitoxin system HicA family toxin [Nitrospiraceae bacterium]
MPKLRRLSGHDVLSIPHRFGFRQTSQRGSHAKLVREVTDARQVLTIPLHRS